MILLATYGTQNPPELPFRHTEGTDQEALAAVTFRTENRDLRPRTANRTNRAGETWRLCILCRRKMLGLGLEQNPREEMIRFRPIAVRGQQETAKHLALLFRRGMARGDRKSTRLNSSH